MIVALLALLLTAPAEPPSACGLARADEASLRAIASATSVSDLLKVQTTDRVGRLFLAYRFTHLAPGPDADSQFIGAIPHREEDLELMYTFTYSCAAPTSIVEFGGGAWVPEVRDAVIRQRKGVKAFLMLAWLYRGNADIGESLPEDIEAIRVALPKDFAKALRSLPKEARRLVVGGRELLPRP